MDRAYASGAAGTPPAPPASPSIGYPQPANPGLGAPATKPGKYWYYMITEEIRNVVAAAGLTPDQADVTQLFAAINAIINASLPQTASIQGAFKNLRASATGTDATVTVSVDEIAVESAANSYKTLRGVALSINSAAAGANGLDTGALAASTWYSVWVIWNGAATAGLLSLSATAPTLPAGYTHKARVGWIRTDGTANKYPLSFIQFGRKVAYKIVAGSNLTDFPTMASGVAGTQNASTYTPVSFSISAFIPSTAFAININLNASGAGHSAALSPTATGFTGWDGAAPAPVQASDVMSEVCELVVDNATLYWASNGATGFVKAMGWEDNL